MKNLIIPLPLIIVLSITFLHSNCKNSENQKEIEFHSENTLLNKDIYIIDLDTMTRTVASYSDIFSSIKYIPLETTSECLIGQIEHIELFNDTIYVLDSREAKSILLFNLSGKFVQKIGKVGKGPGEWSQPTSFTIDKTKRLLYVLDANLQRIAVLTLQGKVIDQFDLKSNGVRSHCIESDQGRIFLDARHYESEEGEIDYMLREISNSGEEIRNWLSFKKDNKGWTQAYYYSGSGSLYSVPAGIKYVDLFMDTIYSITKEGLKPFIAIKSSTMIKKETLTDIQKLSGNGGSFVGELSKQDAFWGIHSYIENDDLIHFIFNGGKNYNLILIDKRTNQIKYLKAFKDDLTFKELASGTTMPNFYSGEKNKIIGGFNKISTFQQSLRINSTNLPDEEKNKLLKISELSNPILILAITK